MWGVKWSVKNVVRSIQINRKNIMTTEENKHTTITTNRTEENITELDWCQTIKYNVCSVAYTMKRQIVAQDILERKMEEGWKKRTMLQVSCYHQELGRWKLEPWKQLWVLGRWKLEPLKQNFGCQKLKFQCEDTMVNIQYRLSSLDSRQVHTLRNMGIKIQIELTDRFKLKVRMISCVLYTLTLMTISWCISSLINRPINQYIGFDS